MSAADATAGPPDVRARVESRRPTVSTEHLAHETYAGASARSCENRCLEDLEDVQPPTLTGRGPRAQVSARGRGGSGVVSSVSSRGGGVDVGGVAEQAAACLPD